MIKLRAPEITMVKNTIPQKTSQKIEFKTKMASVKENSITFLKQVM
jgi:hypothetical protein